MGFGRGNGRPRLRADCLLRRRKKEGAASFPGFGRSFISENRLSQGTYFGFMNSNSCIMNQKCCLIVVTVFFLPDLSSFDSPLNESIFSHLHENAKRPPCLRGTLFNMSGRVTGLRLFIQRYPIFRVPMARHSY